MATLASLLLLLAAQEPDPQGIEFFEKHVRPVLVERCYPCHSGKAEKIKGDLRLDTRAGLLKGGADGPVLAAGDPDRSRLILAVRYADADLRMPPKAKLPADQVAAFEAWVRRGAPIPEEARPAATLHHWAFAPPRKVAPPPGPGNEIDRFILAKLAENGLTLSPPADRRTLLRRATFDLLGLPPTPEEVDAFLADESPDAFEKVVDRLLASPHYGERWGRHWLDVARYADTKGYVQRPEDRRFVHAWAYRDWVIRALNQDLPYDQFVIRQIAADRLPDARDSLPAMGFLTVGRRFKNMVHDIIDDRIDVVTRGLMGLTVGCARCHDHKFDPIPIRDYYSLYGVFAGSTEATVALGAGSETYEAGLKRRTDAYQKAFRRHAAELERRHRSRLPEYLALVADPKRLPPDDLFAVLPPDALNPAVARRWQEVLSSTRRGFHPVFAPWTALADLPPADWIARAPVVLKDLLADPRLNRSVAAAFDGPIPASMSEVAARYGALLSDPKDDELRRLLDGDASPVKVPAGELHEIEYFLDSRMRQELFLLRAAIDRWILESDGAPPHAVLLQDRPDPPNPRVFRRGNPATKGEEVPRRFLSTLSDGEPLPFQDGSGRLELALSIVGRDNPLTARVMVNRLWLHHFGTGLVRSPSDFGSRSDRPTHPELLDFLAIRFMETWSIKSMHRLILHSAVYRQDSRDNPDAARRDPENALLWRMNRRRLDFETLRDALLFVSGRLDPSIGGRPEDLTTQPFSTRRTVYGLIDRLNLAGVFGVFDFPSPDAHSPQRHVTSAAPQALFLMNSPFVQDQARALAAHPDLAGGVDDSDRIRRLYRRVFGRPPTAQESAWGRAFVERPDPPPPPPAAPDPWRYGFGELDEAAGKVETFTLLPRFTGNIWHEGPRNLLISPSAQVVDVKTGWATLSAQGGHPGKDLRHAVIRRWVAPRAAAVEIRGSVTHLQDGERSSDGIRARIVSSRAGVLAVQKLRRETKKMELPRRDVEEGETIDFIVDGGADPDEDAFTWAPIVAAPEFSWDAARDFRGPVSPRLTSWEKYAQVLLESNEFIFVD